MTLPTVEGRVRTLVVDDDAAPVESTTLLFRLEAYDSKKRQLDPKPSNWQEHSIQTFSC